MQEVRIGHPAFLLMRNEDIDAQIKSASITLDSRMEAFTEVEGSGWTVGEFLNLELNIAAYDAISGNSFILTPKSFANKSAIVNVKNTEDDFCFLYSIIAQLYPCQDRNPETVTQYKQYMHILDRTGLEFLMKLVDIFKFERLNPNFSVSVLYVDADERSFYPVRVTTFRDRLHHVNLLLLHNSATGKSHYTLVKNLSALLNTRSRNNGLVHVCPYCLHRFKFEHGLAAHISECGMYKPLLITFPSKFKKSTRDGGEDGPIEGIEDLLGITAADADEVEVAAAAFDVGAEDDEDPPNILKFKNVIRQFPVPFVIYADFEAFIVKNGERDDHEPSGFCCLTVSSFPEYNNARAFVYSGENVMLKFFEHLRSEERKINEILMLNIEMRPLTEGELLRKQEVTH